MKNNFLENETLILCCMCLAVLRIYLEVIQFNFAKLPLTSKLSQEQQIRIHRSGLIFSIAVIILFAPRYFI